ncbi:Integrase, catalytic core [Penicillium expansum]|nr:Integrase, catalytic core [Penicillium expansum]
MTETHGSTDPKFTELVPSLKGETNWEQWNQLMEIALNGKNLTYWGLLTGIEGRPRDLTGDEASQPGADEEVEVFQDATPAPTGSSTAPIPTVTSGSGSGSRTTKPPTAAAIRAQAKLQASWDQRNAVVLSYVASTLDVTMSVYLRRGKTAAEVYEDLRQLCEAKNFYSVSNKAIKWATWKYKPGNKPEDFVTKWRHLLTEMQEAYPAAERVSALHAIHMFLHAVGGNTGCQHWLNTVSIREDWSYDRNLQHIFGDFIASEGRRIGNDRVQSQQQASSNVASTDKKKKDKKKKDSKKDSKDSKDQVWCPFHKRETVHKPADCFLNPKNKKDSKPESANKADAKPAAANAASSSPDNLWVSATYVNVNSVSATVSLNDAPDPNVWMLDSGCSAHMTPCRSVFHTFTAKTLPIHSATGETFYAEGYGDVVIDLAKFDYSVDDQDTTERIRMGGIVLRKVWYAPSLKHSLISTRQLAETGTMAITFFKDHTELKSMITGEVKGYATVGNNQYWLYTYKNAQISHLRSLMETNCLTPSVSAVENTTGSPEDDNLFVSASKVGEPISISMDLAHRRACHAGESRVKKTQDCTDGLMIKKKSALTRPCAPCVIGKGHALPFGKNKSIRTNPGDLIHTDVWGPISIASTGGYNYYVTFTDDASRFCWVFLIKHRSEVLEKFIQVEQWLKTQLNLTVKRVSGDNAREHEPLREYVITKGAVWDLVPPYTPRLNGIPEIKNKHLLEPVVAIMSEHELPKYLWGPILQGVNYTQNRLYHSKVECTPFEKLFGYQPDLSHLRALGCQCWYMIPKERRQTKLHPHSAEGRFLGYDQRGHYQIYDTSTKKIVISRDVVFNETLAVSLPKHSDDLDAGKQFSKPDSRYVPLEFINLPTPAVLTEHFNTRQTPPPTEPIERTSDGHDTGVEAQIEVGPEEIPREDPVVTDTQDDPLQISDLPDQDPALPVPSSLPNLVYEAIQPPGQEQVAL